MSDTTFTYPSTEPLIVISRVFDAPRELVWKACTEAEHMARWWGPRRYTSEVLEMDVRPGGAWRIDQHTPEGRVYRFSGVFRDLVAPERLVLTFAFEGMPEGTEPVVETHTFEEHEGGTRLTTVSRFGTLEDREGMRASGMEDGARESYERLAELLESLRRPGATADGGDEAEREIVVSRLYDAPRDLVFDAWTDPEHIGQWWGPNGFTTTVHEMDVRPGGLWRFMMHGPDGTDWPNRVAYEEVTRPERLVYMHGSDEEPEAFHVTVTFADEGGKTRLTLRSLFPTAEALAEVLKFGAIEGGKQTLARLADYLLVAA